MPELLIPEKLEPFLFKKKRFKVAIGGRGGGKTQSIADMLLFKSQTEGVKVGCFREFQNSIEDSVHSVLAGEIERMDLAGFTVTNNAIRCDASGGEFKFKGIARNPDSVKSMHGFKIFWHEEAQAISHNSLTKVIPTLREEGSEHWFSLNPQSSADPVSRRFIKPYERQLRKHGFYEDDLHYIVWINYTDNPWFPEVLELDRRTDKEIMSDALYAHIWLGEYNDTVENAIIPTAWFDAAIDAHIKLGFSGKGARICAHDPSDEGEDNKAVGIRWGSVIEDVAELDSGNVNDGCDWATSYAIERDADLFTWDCDGLGVTLRRQVADAFKGKRIDYVMFKGSESPENPREVFQSDGERKRSRTRTNAEALKNNRAQKYWLLRDRFFNTYQAVVHKKYIDPEKLISLSSDIENMEQLRSEVCRIPLKRNPSGVIQIASKIEMKAMGIPSPNMSDVLMMLMITPELNLNKEPEQQAWDPFDPSVGY